MKLIYGYNNSSLPSDCATERMLEALTFHAERDFHINDYIREPDEKPGQGKPVDLRPAGWLTLFREQLAMLVKGTSNKK